MNAEAPQRRIRSFVRRESRMTPGQQRALETLANRYLVNELGAIDLDTVFGRTAPRHLEIGFGMGESLAATAAAHPEHDYLGIEVHRPGIARLLMRAAEQDLTNLRVASGDAVEILTHRLGEGVFDAIHVFFPDPWPKKRHHKRRLINPGFAALLVRKLKPGGRLHLATDWEDYAEQMLTVLNATPGLRNLAADGRYVARPEFRPVTKFERRGEALGHAVRDLAFERV